MSQDDDLALLRRCLEEAERIHESLGDHDFRTGVIGAARTLVKKLKSTISHVAATGGTMDQVERLACNAWRMHWAATNATGELPPTSLWNDLADDERIRWRQAAIQFGAREDDR